MSATKKMLARSAKKNAARKQRVQRDKTTMVSFAPSTGTFTGTYANFERTLAMIQAKCPEAVIIVTI